MCGESGATAGLPGRGGGAGWRELFSTRMSESNEGIFEQDTPPATGRALKRLAIGAVVLVAAGVAAFFIHELRFAPKAAKKDYERAVADWAKAGLRDPLAPHAPVTPVPDAVNLLKVSPFDGLGVVGNPSGPAARWLKVDQFNFTKPQSPKPGSPRDHFGFDPAQHFVPATPPSKLIPKPAPGQTPARVFIETLEKEFPELTGMEVLVRERPELALPPMDWSTAPWTMPVLSFKYVRANSCVLTAYAGCRAIEGDGAPAATVVPVMLRYARAAGERGFLIDTMIANVVTKLSVPKLTRLALEKGLWTDEQIARVQTELARTRFSPALREALVEEMATGLKLAVGFAGQDPEADRLWAGLGGGNVQSGLANMGLGGIFPETKAWRNARTLLDRNRSILLCFDSKAGWDAAGLIAVHDAIALAEPGPDTELCDLAMPAYVKVLANCALTDCQLASAELGCALEHFRRKTGAYPETLDGLTPEFIAAIPGGIWKGQKLVYTRTAAGGYTLTWPGADLTDGFGGVQVDRTHPGPWDIEGHKIELPEFVTMFDTRMVTKAVARPVDVVWTMDAPPAAKKPE